MIGYIETLHKKGSEVVSFHGFGVVLFRSHQGYLGDLNPFKLPYCL
jgi:hypothetical protein